MNERGLHMETPRAHTVCNVGNELNGKTLGMIAHIIIFIELRMHIVIVHLRVL